MKKQIVVCASPHQHKYFFEPSFNDMPLAIREEITEAVAAIAEKVNAVITLGFNENGHMFIEQTEDENVFVDDIGAELEIKKFQKEKEELLKSMRLWYMIYRTEQGQLVKEVVLYQSKGYDKARILQTIEEEKGVEAKAFVAMLLEDE
ncbi:MAG: DUF6145 family protein [Cellulosilyticaceae bacterium]